jgi:hypothetical protein
VSDSREKAYTRCGRGIPPFAQYAKDGAPIVLPSLASVVLPGLALVVLHMPARFKVGPAPHPEEYRMMVGREGVWQGLPVKISG